MANKFNHLSLDDRKVIEFELNNNNNIKEISMLLNKNYSTIRREIQNRKTKFERKTYGDIATACLKKRSCNKRNICNSSYPCFVKESCERLDKSPYVCNGCKSRNGCRKERLTYLAKNAHDDYLINFSESKKGIDLSLEEIENINKIITPLIKEKKQSINHVYVNHSDILNFSKQTFYNYIDYNIFSFRNIDLPRKVRYKVRKNSYKRRTKAENAIKDGRRHSDFVEYTNNNPNSNIVEMDCVEGIKGGKVMLTLLWRKSNFMLIYIMDKQTMLCVEEVFNSLKKILNDEVFKKLFEVILTDNGSEFFNPLSIEVNNNTGEKVSNLFYCDPGDTNQKSSLEKNHQFIRYILPKGSSFNTLTQQDCFNIANNINNLNRDSLNNRTPYEAQLFITDENILSLLNMKYIHHDDVNLSTSIIEK